jgi:hypothetical protein
MRVVATALLALLSLGCTAQTIATPSQLISAMHDRYASKWYHTLTFEQQSITHKADGTQSTELWHEAMMVPGKLRIDIGDRSAGKGVLFVNNHLYVFKDGKLANEREFIHPLLVLGFDVYGQSPEATIQQLKELKLDLSLLHEESFEGRPMYVIGAKPGDLQSLQFWIDKEQLYFVRMLKPGEKPGAPLEDIRFDDYKQVQGGGWVAEHVAMVIEGKLVFEEKYSDVKVNPPLSNDLFEPEHFLAAGSAPAK